MKIRRSLATLGASAALALGAAGALAPAAEAASQSGSPTAVFKATDRDATVAGAAGRADGTAALAAGTKADVGIQATCWNARTSGRYFYMTCNGQGYRVYVDCSNGYRYISSTLYYGTWNHTLACPSGTNAIWGGSIGG
ncbi:hypothetical protein ACIBAI_11245 [Streptomyces sp. NPDC051041]|uniref:hypothetical protein n=1 Tax=Streptomyces sp. NPDC051041 TaxID=3365640 RepID=UPI0037972F5D